MDPGVGPEERASRPREVELTVGLVFCEDGSHPGAPPDGLLLDCEVTVEEQLVPSPERSRTRTSQPLEVG
jgi:hypothetical protein